MRNASDLNLLFGLLAFQHNFISREILIAVTSTWLQDKKQQLATLLVDGGYITDKRCQLLKELVAEHLDDHDDDVEKSLHAIRLAGDVREELEALDDEQIDVSLGHVSEIPSSDPDATQPWVAGESRFQILHLHARGGLGQVFLARDHELNREVALKEIQDRYADDANSRARFLLEGEITGGLEHPGVVPVYGLGQYPDGRPFYAMRFIRGDSMKEAIAAFHEKAQASRDATDRAMRFRRLLAHFIDVCYAVEYAHSRGVLHRDLKPSNIMLGKYGETLVVDWGLAKSVGRSHAHQPSDETTLRPSSGSGSAPTQIGRALGTPLYMSPEQARGQIDELDPTTDVYSLGATLFTLLTGQTPFDEKDPALMEKVKTGQFRKPSEVVMDVSPSLEEICVKAMSLNKGDRFPSSAQLAEAIERWLANQPVDAYINEVAQMKRAADADPADSKTREGLGRSLMNLGIMYHAMSRFEEAASVLQEASNHFKWLVEQQPDAEVCREHLAAAHLHLSRTLRSMGRDDRARDAHLAALKEYEQLVDANPDVRHYRAMRDEIEDTIAHFEEPLAATSSMQGQIGDEKASGIRFKVLKPVGQGALGELLLAHDQELGRDVVLKLAAPEVAHVLSREAKILARLDHPNIVSIFGTGQLPDDRHFIAMPYFSATLQDRLTAGVDIDDALGLNRWLRTFITICNAIAYAHAKHVVHMDIKPGNIMSGEFGQVVVSDWGLAKVMDEHDESPVKEIASSITVQGTLMGTPAYMAPEQVHGRREDLGPHTDIYALGGLLFHMLTGTPANRAGGEKNVADILQATLNDTPPQAVSLNPNVPSQLDAICTKALARQPDQRYPNVRELAQDVECYLASDRTSDPGGKAHVSFVRRMIGTWTRSP